MCVQELNIYHSFYQRINLLPSSQSGGGRIESLLVISSNIININVYWFSKGSLATSGDWSLNFNLQTLLWEVSQSST